MKKWIEWLKAKAELAGTYIRQYWWVGAIALASFALGALLVVK